MTAETYQWLADNVLAGFAIARPPWWAKYAEREGHTPNLFDGPVPMDRVHTLLASWTPKTTRVLDEEDVIELIKQGHAGADLIRMITESCREGTHKLVKADDNNDRLGLVGVDSVLHTYREWLTDTVTECVGDEAQISSAGLLRNRAQAWVQIERPETAVGPAGVKFSPYVTLSTSLDASMATQINQNTTMTICDNTLSVTRGQGLSFKHTSGSSSKLGVYRGVMSAIMQGEHDFRAVLERLLAEQVSDDAFDKFVAALVPIADDDLPAKKTRSNRKRQQITDLYRTDERVAQWKGSAFGALQAVNTWDQHMSRLVNRTGVEMDDTNLRAMRNYADRMRAPKGETSDQATMRVLHAVLA
jgi:phage/plasmid-like protein (TIGR03299 family)